MKPQFVLWLLVSILLLAACRHKTVSNAADTIYFGGDIVTMEGDQPTYVEAIAVKDGKIVFTGTKNGAGDFQGDSTEMLDLQGKSLYPGFIDAHAHFGAFSLQAIGANLLPPPDGTVVDIASLVQTLKAWASPENIALTGWIFGTGYDESVLKEGRHPTRQELDQVSAEHPIIIVHISGHFCVMNSKGLELMKITAATRNPAGGVIRRMPGSDEPNGVLEELAAIPLFSKALIPSSAEAAGKFAAAGQEMALSYGYTTAQDGRAMDLSMAKLAESGFLKLDVVSYIDYSVPELMLTKWYGKSYTNHFRIGGVKLTLDGSPQGRTAWRTIPYILPPPGEKSSYKGYAAIASDKEVEAIYSQAFKNNWQIITHANGDAAIDQMIRCMKGAITTYGNKDRRNTLIHGQYIREDQLDSLKNMSVIASLFPLHTFYWGDWHKQIIGDSLGNRISPTRSALNKGLRLTIHTDAPVALPNLMRMVWTAVSRTSRTGKIIGEGEKLTPYEALKCITDWSAYQHFEEQTKGTITKGKLADLVILDKNPLKVKVDDIKEIKVLETIKAGKRIYKR
ncbi:amidohydrolase [Flavihumibacter sp. CACIAM 22H1]|uniref:amidohydrolase n=1 Tax=Flavihumibacter sp. CACIAM 22H1 TaxID=1812911 RepID=UPI0007A8CDD6|nr:amidohydrolase [Flavihumibacter sp. CACIAM 22H1]KYP13142.1 MAG: amidohydrolase [Flavihumibacter sp. CACIAM 22H1]